MDGKTEHKVRPGCRGLITGLVGDRTRILTSLNLSISRVHVLVWEEGEKGNK